MFPLCRTWQKKKTFGNRKADSRCVKLFEVTNSSDLRKSAICKVQTTSKCGVNDTDLCFVICGFFQVVFVNSNNFTYNLLFLFPIVFGTSHYGRIVLTIIKSK